MRSIDVWKYLNNVQVEVGFIVCQTRLTIKLAPSAGIYMHVKEPVGLPLPALAETGNPVYTLSSEAVT